MIVLRVLSVLGGAFLVVGVVDSAVRTVILPRASRSALSAAVFRMVRMGFRLVAARFSSWRRRDRVMALLGPVGLMMIVASWLVLTLAGFTLVFWGLDSGPLGRAFTLSGSSLTTLGFAGPERILDQALAFLEALLGLFVLTLLITYLPAIYSAFRRREVRVARLEVRAGSPPSAVEFLLRYYRIGWLGRLEEEFQEWEAWFAEIEESQTSYPVLSFFRSPHPERSWITAAGTVLDAAALFASSIDGYATAPAAVCLRSGYLALRRIADGFRIVYDGEPASTDPVVITREEFDDALIQLADEGLPVVGDREAAWLAFAGWRVNYETVLLELAELVMAPFAPWTSDRSPPGLGPPTFSRLWKRPGRR